MRLTPGAPIDGVAPSLMAHRRATQSVPPPIGADGKPGAAVADRSSIGGEAQVQSQVRVVEVNRVALQEFGINLFGRTNIGNAGHPRFIGGTSTPGNVLSSIAGGVPIANLFNLAYASSDFSGALSLLENRGLARTLAEPSLTAMSGQTASFLAGGEFPYPVPQGGGSGVSTVTIQFREFGVRLNLTPTVLSSDRIALKVAPEVSELDFTNAVTVLGTTIPALIVRRTDTTVELGDGESFVLSGLVSENLRNNVYKVPGLGDIPILGAFFRSTSISRVQKELIMVVTPHLVRPIAKGAALPALPGESISRYKPNMAETIFLETGDFGQGSDSGYSK
jgi:pilus assembly protein CpaC